MRPDAEDDATPMANPSHVPNPSCARLWGDETGIEQGDDLSSAAVSSTTPGKCSHCEVRRVKKAPLEGGECDCG